VSEPAPPPRVFRLPALAYLVVLFLVFGSVPVAFTASGHEAEQAVVGPQTLVLIIPLLAAVFIARWATFVDAEGVTVRAAFGRQRFMWDQIRGLALDGPRVYLVLADGSVRLPCVRMTDLGALSRASGGHLPELPDPTPKHAPQRRRRR
jgi:hypothetical protein